MKKLTTLFTLILIIGLFSCTQNERVKTFGGKATIKVPCGQKVNNITWKGTEVWYSTEPMKDGHEPVTHTFREEASWGLIEGVYFLKESNCK